MFFGCELVFISVTAMMRVNEVGFILVSMSDGRDLRAPQEAVTYVVIVVKESCDLPFRIDGLRGGA